MYKQNDKGKNREPAKKAGFFSSGKTGKQSKTGKGRERGGVGRSESTNNHNIYNAKLTNNLYNAKSKQKPSISATQVANQKRQNKSLIFPIIQTSADRNAEIIRRLSAINEYINHYITNQIKNPFI